MQLSVLRTEYPAGSSGDLYNRRFHAVAGEQTAHPFPVVASDDPYGHALNCYGDFLSLDIQLGRKRFKCVGVEVLSADLFCDDPLTVQKVIRIFLAKGLDLFGTEFYSGEFVGFDAGDRR